MSYPEWRQAIEEVISLRIGDRVKRSRLWQGTHSVYHHHAPLDRVGTVSGYSNMPNRIYIRWDGTKGGRLEASEWLEKINETTD